MQQQQIAQSVQSPPITNLVLQRSNGKNAVSDSPQATTSRKNTENKFESAQDSYKRIPLRYDSDITVNTMLNRIDSFNIDEDRQKTVPIVKIQHKVNQPNQQSAQRARDNASLNQTKAQFEAIAIGSSAQRQRANHNKSRSSNQPSRLTESKSSAHHRKKELMQIQQIHDKNYFIKVSQSNSEKQLISPRAFNRKATRSACTKPFTRSSAGRRIYTKPIENIQETVQLKKSQNEINQSMIANAGNANEQRAAKFQNETILDSVNSQAQTGTLQSKGIQQLNANDISFANAQPHETTMDQDGFSNQIISRISPTEKHKINHQKFANIFAEGIQKPLKSEKISYNFSPSLGHQSMAYQAQKLQSHGFGLASSEDDRQLFELIPNQTNEQRFKRNRGLNKLKFDQQSASTPRLVKDTHIGHLQRESQSQKQTALESNSSTT